MSGRAQAENRRGSPEVVEKRRAARLFNDALAKTNGAARADGRTERRRKRLLAELEQGASRGGKKELTPIDVLSRVNELLLLGEPLASIKKVCPPPRAIAVTPALIERIRRLHKAYRFAIAAYRFVGLDAEALARAGIARAKTLPRQ